MESTNNPFDALKNDGFQIVGQKKRHKDKKKIVVNKELDTHEETTEKGYEHTNQIHFNKLSKKNFSNETNIKNRKKILCNNVLYNGFCNYGSKCMYAHSLEDQIVDTLRKYAYDLLKSTQNLANIDLVKDAELYRTLITLTRLCDRCAMRQCPGGYNCKNGAISKSYVVCYDDLEIGNCDNPTCPNVHLTKRGLIPYRVRENIYHSYSPQEKDTHITNLKKIVPTGTIVNQEFIKKIYDTQDQTKKNVGGEESEESDESSDSELDMNIEEDQHEYEISIFTSKNNVVKI